MKSNYLFAFILFSLTIFNVYAQSETLTVNILSVTDTTANINTIATISGDHYLLVLDASEPEPAANTIRESGLQQLGIDANTQITFSVSSLSPLNSYKAYAVCLPTGTSEFLSDSIDFQTLTAVLPVLSTSLSNAGKWSVIISVTLSQDGIVWCAPFDATDLTIPTTTQILNKSLSQFVIADENTDYAISSVEPAISYNVYCVAQNNNKYIMSNSIESTRVAVTTQEEIPILSYINYDSTTVSITATVQLNINSKIYAIIRPYQQGQSLPTIEELLASTIQFTVVRDVRTPLVFENLVHNSQYQISLYITSIQGLPTQLSISQLTTLVYTAKNICPIYENLPALPEGEQATVDCVAGYSGTLTGVCLATGEWELTNNCVRLTCAQENEWPLTNSLTLVNLDCDIGYTGQKTRFCKADGSWDAPTSTCEPLYCQSDDSFPTTQAGQIAEKECPINTFGTLYRLCNAQGVWETSYGTCRDANICSAEGEWPQTYEGQYATGACPDSRDGYSTRPCLSEGWGEISYEHCDDYKCLADGDWPKTEINNYAYVKCATDDNNMRRYCNSDRQWGPIDSSHCAQIYCLATGNWPKTLGGNTVTIPCEDNQIGLQTRTCDIEGHWQEIQQSCITPSCPADGKWPELLAGQTIRIDCDATYSGSVYRTCTVDGWNDPIEECTPIYCPATEDYPETRAGTDYHFACGEHYEGQKAIHCNDDGTWGTIDESQCVYVYRCPADDIWVETVSGNTVTLPCGGIYDGEQTRACLAEGVWDTVDRTACVRVFCPAIDDVYVETDRDVTIYTDCPESQIGVQYRKCNHEGQWEDINSLNCYYNYCHADSVWPDTEINKNAELPCSTGLSGSILRYCDSDGNWQTPDYSQCKPLTCPEEVTEIGTWPETAYNTQSVRIPCAYGYSNYLYRDCLLDGTWGPIDELACTLKFCPAEGVFPSTPSFSSAEIACPAGYSGTLTRYCDNGNWWAVQGECKLITCPADGDYPETPAATTVNTDCSLGYQGQIHRTCNEQGVWEPIVNECERIYCSQETVEDVTWPSTASGETATVDCEGGEGIRFRTCNMYGQWVGDGLTCWANKCAAEGDWPITYPGKIATIECSSDYTGNKQRKCLPLGYWDTEIIDNCVQRQCITDGIWPSTPLNTVASIACTGGAQGMMTRQCNSQAEWEEPDKTQCIAPQCAADGEWPETTTDTTSYLACEEGYTGYRTRYCNGLGQWLEADNTKCYRMVCMATDIWPTTLSGETAFALCSEGYTGIESKTCNMNGQWEETDYSKCQVIMCPADGIWEETQYNVTLHKSCPLMTVGEITRTCNGTGVWEDVQYLCSPVYCPQDTTLWAPTLAGEIATVPCYTGYTGNMTRSCSLEGEWNQINLENCHNQNCPVSGLWPETQVDVTITLPCAEGYSGVQTRHCDAADRWGEVDSSNCHIYPIITFTEPELLDYSAVLHFTVNTPSKVYYELTLSNVLLDKEALLAHDPVHIVNIDTTSTLSFDNLLQTTQYRLNVYILSDDNIESPLSIETNSPVFMTIPIILPQILVHQDSLVIDSTSVQLSVSFTQKFGTVWCNVVDGEPTVEKITTGSSVVIGEPNVSSRITISNLSVETEYTGYCYCEDYRSIPMDITTIPATQFIFKTGYNQNTLTIKSLETTYNHEKLSVNYSHRGQVCCLISIPSDAHVISSIDECNTDIVDVTAEVDAFIEYSQVEDNTNYIANCLAVYHYDNTITAIASLSFYTPMKFPVITISSVTPSYDYIRTSVSIDRPGSIWCYASSTESVTSIDVIKKAPQYNAGENTVTAYITEPVTSETEYHISCYAENTYHTPAETLAFIDATTLSVPSTVTVYEATPSISAVSLTVKCTKPTTVYCLALGASNTVPSVDELLNGEHSSCTAVTIITITNLTPITNYKAYCLGYDADERLNRNSIESTETPFTTLRAETTIDSMLLVPIENENADRLTAVCTDCYKMACLLLSSTTPVPQTNTIYTNGQSLFNDEHEHEYSFVFDFRNLEPNYSYSIYCHATGFYGNAMSTESAMKTFVSPAYPIITLSSLPSEAYAASAKVTSNISSHIRCIAKLSTDDNTSTPPTYEEVFNGAYQTFFATEYTFSTIRVERLQPNTNYDLWCVSSVSLNNNDVYDYHSIEPVSIGIKTMIDSTRPTPYIACQDCTTYLVDVPIVLVLTFNRPIVQHTFIASDFTLSNLLFDHYETVSAASTSKPEYKLFVIPVVAGSISLSLNENTVQDTLGNQNVASSTFSKIFKGGLLTVTLTEADITATSVILHLTFTKVGTGYCMKSENNVPTKDDLKASPFSVELPVDVSTPLTITGLAASMTHTIYCYAERTYVSPSTQTTYYEPMESTIISTKKLVHTTDGNCPKVNELICNSRGECIDGETCMCYTYSYGISCDKRCPGFYTVNTDVYECSGHGICNEVDHEPLCTCTNTELYGGDDCSLYQMSLDKPTAGNTMIFITQHVEPADDFIFETQGFGKKQQVESFRLAQSQVLGNTIKNSRADSWDLTRLSTTLLGLYQDESSNKLSLIFSSHVMVANSEVENVHSKLTNSTENVDTWKNALKDQNITVKNIMTTKSFNFPSTATDSFYCYNGELSNDETDIDCGGPTCVARCDVNKKCKSSDDCQSNLYCDKFEKICKVKTLSTLATVAISGTVVLVLLLIGIFIFIYCLYVKKPKEGKYYFEEEDVSFYTEAKKQANANKVSTEQTSDNLALSPDEQKKLLSTPVVDVSAEPPNSNPAMISSDVLDAPVDAQENVEIHIDDEDDVVPATTSNTLNPSTNTNDASTQSKNN